MAKVLQAVRGMNDILPDESCYWAQLEALCRDILTSYAYQEIRFPLLEETALFKRGIGEVTDIVEKEMYTFHDRNGDSLTLRPEGTAGCVRASIEHGLLHNQIQRLWYMGPMFRHERPQKGRYRQFHQLGVEAFGMAGPEIDAEVILISQRLLHALGLKGKVTLQLNSLGNPSSRAIYRAQLVNYLLLHRDQLDEESERRLQTNPLRILDSKNPALQTLIAEAPKMIDYLDDAAEQHFNCLLKLLDQLGVSYKINPQLVRGLDYYGLTAFEWVTDQLGAQGTVCGGGRYDGLVELLGGKPTPAIGFACGLERLVLLLKEQINCVQQPDIFMVLQGQQAIQQGLVWSEKLRDRLPQLKIEVNLQDTSLKSQFKRADRSGAQWALIIAAEEVVTQTVTLKNLRQPELQRQFSFEQCVDYLMKGGDTHGECSR